jgi:photosystem II stability/assembly factor-like uncharacterized protein
MAAKKIAVLVGTEKGAYIFRSNASRTRWAAEGPLFPGEPVHHMAYDPRDGESVYAACNFTWGGPKIRVSRDQGKTWKVVSNPAFPKGKVATSNAWVQGQKFPVPVTAELAFMRTWHIEPGHASQPNVMWAGIEPAALFRSDDKGETWTEIASLTDHRTRDQWSPGGGGLMVHSIAIDAKDPKKIMVGISSAGIFESSDGGKTWEPKNEGITNPMEPKKRPEVGYCVHHMVAHPTVPGVRFQQNHFGVLWLDDGAAKWDETSKGLPDESMQFGKHAYGFASAIHPHDPDTAYVVPLAGNDRMAAEAGTAVYGSKDRGTTWKRMAKGLPKSARFEVYREGMSTDRLDPAGIYFGTANGEVWGSADEGKTWAQIAAYLPPVMAVSTATM